MLGGVDSRCIGGVEGRSLRGRVGLEGSLVSHSPHNLLLLEGMGGGKWRRVDERKGEEIIELVELLTYINYINYMIIVTDLIFDITF